MEIAIAFVVVVGLAFTVLAKQNGFSIKKPFAGPKKPEEVPEELPGEYSFEEGLTRLGNIPKLSPYIDSFDEEVVEHIRNYRN